jgi:hypothetical protein
LVVAPSFLDIDDIPFGVDFREHIHREVQQCDVMLVRSVMHVDREDG